MHRASSHANIRSNSAAGAKVRLVLLMASEKADAFVCHLRQKVAEVSRKMRHERQRLLELIRQREGHLTKLLADSTDAVVVTDDTHRFLAANQPALDLFGVSERNMQKFTIDAFLPFDEIRFFERTVPRFVRGTEKHGECKIRRLDGALREVEFTFQANFVLGRHLSVLHDLSGNASLHGPVQDQRVL